MTDKTEFSEALAFGQTVVFPLRRRLVHAGRSVEVGARAFDLLMTLIRARGAPVSRGVIRALVWPGRVVEDNTIEARVSVLRKALDDDRDAIRTIGGLGYEFVAEVFPLRQTFLEDHSSIALTSDAPTHVLRSAFVPLIGRDRDIAQLTELIQSRRLITLVGTGGVGKTRLARHVARMVAPDYEAGVHYAELGGVSGPEYVVNALAVAVGVTPGSDANTLESLVAELRSRHRLLVIDNCEHLIESVALAIDHLLAAAPRLGVMATSRESLRLNGEYLYRVAPLDVPADNSERTARTSGAFLLFDYIVSAAGSTSIRDVDLPIALEICRKLDGIPQAVELAAAYVPIYGLAGVADQLDDQFWSLARGPRTTVLLQQTLFATLDWSYALLDPKQKTILERLSLFSSDFTLDAALSVAADAELAADDVLLAMMGLEAKSLLSVLGGFEVRRFRLLETTRSYARAKHKARLDYPSCAMRHAAYVLNGSRER